MKHADSATRNINIAYNLATSAQIHKGFSHSTIYSAAIASAYIK